MVRMPFQMEESGGASCEIIQDHAKGGLWGKQTRSPMKDFLEGESVPP